MNVGEGGEFALKMRLVRMRDEGLTINGEAIIDVGFDGEYESIPNAIYEEAVIAASVEDKDKLVELGKRAGLSKAAPRDKADVYINGVGYSVKCLAGANPAMVNHTHRVGFMRVCNCIGVDISTLDSIIERYWELRTAGTIKEDVRTNDPYSPFKDYKEYLRPILEFFFFKGSGSGCSVHQAEYLLDYVDPFDESTWRIIDKDDAIDEFWDYLVFSVRSKGMPEKDENIRPEMKKWTRFCDGSYKGSLHIRVDKKLESRSSSKRNRSP